MAAWTEHTFLVNPGIIDLRRRSKYGCIDCKAAKVRCDEARPFCGTCTRRRRACQGYVDASRAKYPLRRVQQTPRSCVEANRRTKRNSNEVSVNSKSHIPEAGVTGVFDEDETQYHFVNSTQGDTSIGLTQDSASIPPMSADLALQPSSHGGDASLSVVPPWISTIPVGAIPEDDGPTINVYFNRHPFELVISPEFVHEMNAAVLMVLQNSPLAIGDALYSIGRVYIDEACSGQSLPLALTRRARTLARLRSKEPNHQLEEMLLMTIAMDAMELIDTRSKAHERTLPMLIGYGASIIKKYVDSGLSPSPLAKYFIRALARQDMMLSLSQTRRNLIRTGIWLDEANKNSADRFMGYTTTLMPLLEELCALAEDVHQNAQDSRVRDYSQEDIMQTALPLTALTTTIPQRATNLRSRICSWRPTPGQDVSAKTLSRLLTQAYASKAAGLLVLYRLMYPAGTSDYSDRIAFKMACEVMVHLNAPPEDLRLSTWPTLVASCEVESKEDRAVALEIFNNIFRARKTGTALQTRNFVVERVWKARDAGEDWNWMTLSRKYPGECIPI